MPDVGQPQAPLTSDFQQYTNGGSDLTTWNTSFADYVQVIGVGTTVVKTAAGNSRTITTDANEPSATVVCKISQLVSTTATRVRMGYGAPPPLAAVPIATPATTTTLGTVELSVAPASAAAPIALGQNDIRVLGWATTAAWTTGFSAAIDSLNYMSVTSAVVAQLPALSTVQELHKVSFFNNLTSTAVITPTGSDLLSTSGAGGATAATAAGPTGGNLKTYLAAVSLGKWIPLG